MEKTKNVNEKSFLMMTGNESVIYMVESFMEEHYAFRRNLLSGKTEMAVLLSEEEAPNDEASSNAENGETSLQDGDLKWEVLTKEKVNSIVRTAKKMGVGGKKSPRQDIEEYIGSDAIPDFDPIKSYLRGLPKWDGKNYVAEFFGRIPGLTTEQLAWCAIWLRSAVAHWLQMDTLHGNEVVPVLIGQQGCGKSTFANRLLPEHLRQYFLDHINFANKFDAEMALTHNLYVNIDEFANMGPSQQGKLKQILSKVKVNGRPIFGKAQADRPRYASFLATTNDEHPLCDPTGSRRYICIHIPAGRYIDNASVVYYDQLYAQVVYELRDKQIPYWFSNDEVARLQERNLAFFKTDDLETMVKTCFRVPEEDEEAKWMSCSEVYDVLHGQYPMLLPNMSMKIKIGQTLKFMGCKSKHTRLGQAYQLVNTLAA